MFIQRLLLILALLTGLKGFTKEHAVTNEISQGRFGEKLLTYIHAKWIAYNYGMTLLFNPFDLSHYLELIDQELPYDAYMKSYFRGAVIKLEDIKWVELNKDCPKILFYVPFFPESKWEHKHPESNGLAYWPYFAVDWSDEQFMSLLRSLISPKYPLPMIDLPEDRFTVALHVRRGGTFDNDFDKRRIPLRFVPDSFYIDQVKEVYQLVGRRPLFIHIFTDDPEPREIAEEYQRALEGIDAVFSFRQEKNSHDANVLEDFFNMMRFDCLIRPESNYSFIVGKLGNFKIVINPEDFEWRNGKLVITETEMEVKGL